MQVQNNTPVTPPLAQPKPEQRTYYSPRGGLTITANPGSRIPSADGRVYLVGFKEIAFLPQADGWGRFTTSDPELIAFLDARMEKQDDVFDAAAYTERTTPPQIRAQQAERELQRKITENNELLRRIVELEAKQRPGQPIK